MLLFGLASHVLLCDNISADRLICFFLHKCISVVAAQLLATIAVGVTVARVGFCYIRLETEASG